MITELSGGVSVVNRIDEHNVRYTIIQEQPDAEFSFIFLPGGPGFDSEYFEGLVKLIDFPGNIYFMDLPGNGSHNVVDADYDYNKWLDILPKSLQEFQNPVLVGHSAGGHFALICPELEDILQGLVILNSTPSLWLEEAAKYAKKFDVPDLIEEMVAFNRNPNQETFDTALAACIPYYFHPDVLSSGRELISKIAFPFQPAVWWQHEAIKRNYNATWIPQNVPTLIINAEYDLMAPYYLFVDDERFQRANIEIIYLEGAGHLPWIEKPEETKNVITKFLESDLKR